MERAPFTFRTLAVSVCDLSNKYHCGTSHTNFRIVLSVVSNIRACSAQRGDFYFLPRWRCISTVMFSVLFHKCNDYECL